MNRWSAFSDWLIMGRTQDNALSSSKTSSQANAATTAREPISMKVIRYESEKLSVKLMTPFVLLAIVVFIVTTLCFLLPRFGRWMLLPVAIATAAGYTIWYIWLRRTTDRVLPAYDGPFAHHPEARLHAIGTKRELGILAMLENVPFEPVVVQQMYSRVFYHVALGIVLILSIGMLIGIPFDNPIVRSFYMTLGPLSVLSAWAVQRLLPTYYRIVPGRLDIMRFSWLTNYGLVLREWDLRHGKVTVDFDKGKVFYIKEGQKKDSIWLYGIAEPYELAKAIMQGAISTSIPPPLPSNRLLN